MTYYKPDVLHSLTDTGLAQYGDSTQTGNAKHNVQQRDSSSTGCNKQKCPSVPVAGRGELAQSSDDDQSTRVTVSARQMMTLRRRPNFADVNLYAHNTHKL